MHLPVASRKWMRMSSMMSGKMSLTSYVVASAAYFRMPFDCVLQEDEEVVEERKRKAEEEPVDVDDDWTPSKPGGTQVHEKLDEDAQWAEDDPDDDLDANFDLPVLYEEDEEPQD